MRSPRLAPTAVASTLFVTSILASASAWPQTEIRSLTGVIEGHEVGGMAIDWIGNVYAGDFGDSVWRITPEGARRELTSGLYGTSGNAVDNQGNLLQSSFYADAITRIDRNGQARPFATRGLDRPVGIAVDKETGEVYVANCGSNSIARISTDGTAALFARSGLFNCPYGLAFDREGRLYTVNYRDNRMLTIDPQGRVAAFATVSEKGLGHLCFKRDRFYVTAFWSHEIYEVTLDKTVRRILGNGEPGLVDGTADNARLSFPMGIACHPWAPRLYVNEDVNEGGLPRRSIIRVVNLEAGK